jgi:cephalosporin-C deacetylase-like acetyl esterase
MKLSRRELLAAGAAVATARPARPEPPSVLQSSAPARELIRPRHPPNLPIRDYLVREAHRITETALADMKTSAGFNRAVAEKRRRFVGMMGLDNAQAVKQHPPVPYETTGVVERANYRIEKLHYESLPNLHVTANLYLPKVEKAERRPAILYVCGHVEQQKVHYQGHPKRFAELGFPTLIVDTVQYGEAPGYHHGCYREGWFHWYSRGYSPAATEVVNGIRGLDLLAARPEVDGNRFGVTGISGGGATTWWIAAADERVKACAPVCGTATLEAHIYDRVIDDHCDCMWWVNTALWDLADVGSLIAPRPLMIASANQDGIFPITSIRRVHAQLQQLYRTLGKAGNLRLVETPGGHSYHEQSRTAIFSWFLEHLMGREVSPGDVGDIELDPGRLEQESTLKVYVTGIPAGNRAATIQDEFIALGAAPHITNATDLERARSETIEKLRHDTFNHFPRIAPKLELQEEYALDGGAGSRFAFTSEDGWRLHGIRRSPPDVQGPVPAVVVLKSPGEERTDSDGFARQIHAPWVKLIVETRGTGDTSWGEELNWHVRRATAWTGRTIASMRVWDALRGLEAARSLPGVDASRISLAARGEMSAVALYAALLDGRVASVFLESPPETQDAASQQNGKGPAIEMLNCLRHTDLAYVAGLLHPAEIILAGEVASTYDWGEDLYRRLGAGGKFRRLKAISDWTLSS